jgi:hypothetical protein
MLDSFTIRNFRGVMGTPLRDGDSGVEQTIDLMRRLIDDAVKDPVVNRTAIEILKAAGVPSFDREAKLRTLYDFCTWPNFLYVEDPVGPFGPKETVRTVRDLLKIRAGDCDCTVTLLAALAGTIGIPTRAVTIAADPQSPREFSHIYLEGEISPSRWIAMDPARPGSYFGSAPLRYFRKRVWSLTDSSFQDLSGARLVSLNGYAMLGQSQDVAAEDISAVGQSVANVIAASKGSPYGSFATPYSPIAPAAGYGVPGYPGGAPGASVSFAGISPTWIIIGLGVVLLMAQGRH